MFLLTYLHKDLKGDAMESKILSNFEEKDGVEQIVYQSFLHEVKNPLSILKGNVSLMELSDPDLKESARWISIKNNLNHLCHLLDDFSTLNKMTTIEKTTYNVINCIYSVYAMFSSSSDDKNLNLCLGNAPDEKIMIHGDQSKIKHAMINLIKNAFEACHDGDTIRIHSESTEGFVSITVTDSGCGMTENVRTTATTPFITYKENGTGLGLALVHWVVKQHGGNLTIESEEGKGSKITMLFPNP